jgi:hypothetical protein
MIRTYDYQREDTLNARAIGLITVALTAGAIVTGCGGGGGEGSSGESSDTASAAPAVKTSQLSKAAYVTRINSECARLRKSLAAEASAYLLKLNGGKPETVGSAAEEVSNAKLGNGVIVPTVEKEMAAIRKQGAPAGDEKEIESILAADQKGVEGVKSLKRTESIRDIIDQFVPATKALDKYGLAACGN